MKVVATVLLGPGSEKVVGDAIRSAAPYVDGVALIESGGGERAVDVAVENFGFLAPELAETGFPWSGNYSDARNFALEAAETLKADFALTLDPDERLELGDPEKFRRALTDQRVDVWLSRDRDTHYTKPRALRCSAGLKWEGKSCEILSGAAWKQRVGILGGCFWELPKEPGKELERSERGVENMPAEIARDPDNPHWRRHLGHCLINLGRYEEAASAFLGAEMVAQEDETMVWCAYKRAQCQLRLGEYRAAEDIAERMITIHAGFLPEWGSILAHVYWNQGEPVRAARWAAAVVSLPLDKSRMGGRDLDCIKNAQRILEVATA